MADSETTFLERASLPHGIAVHGDVVLLTEPGLERPGAPARVVALEARTGRELGELPAPPGGFRLPFSVRVPRPGRLVVLDNAGFPPQGAPAVHEFRLDGDGGFAAAHERTVSFEGLPLAFAEDLEVLSDGAYVVSDSVGGALWLIEPDGTIAPGLVPSAPDAPLPGLAGGAFPEGPVEVGGLPFGSIGGFAPGVGSLCVRGDRLLFGSTALGGLHAVALATLRDADRPAPERAREITTVSPRPADVALESLKGGAWDPARPDDPWLYVGDPFRLRLLRVHLETGEREVVGDDPRLFDFPVACAFLAPPEDGAPGDLLVVGDQEYRWAGLNSALGQSAFRPPWVIARVRPPASSPARP